MKQLASYDGPFGKVRVVERLSDGARSYLTNDSMQTLVDTSGNSLFGYVNAMKMLLAGRQKVMLIGGAGGSLATMLARKGRDVTVVDIDPMSRFIAERYFNLDPRIEWVTANGLTFLQQHSDEYDAVVVDACSSEGTVDGFINAGWIESAMSRVTSDGVLMVNLAYALAAHGKVPTDGLGLSEKLSDSGFHSILFSPECGWEGNEILLVSRYAKPVTIRQAQIMLRPAEARSYLLSLTFHRRRPVT